MTDGAITILPLRLRADPSRVVIRPFHLAWQSDGVESGRAARLIERILSLPADVVQAQLDLVHQDFAGRHWKTQQIFLQRFADLAHQLSEHGRALMHHASRPVRELIGAYFCHEYSFMAAALMNPSVVPHPDQSGLRNGAVRFLMSMRAVGEGHISSITFREGIVTPEGKVELMPHPPFAIAATALAGTLEDEDPAVTVYRPDDTTTSGMVLFPVTDAQRNGLEDLRLTLFTHDDGRKEWIGTYTAYDGKKIGSELLRTSDFSSFDLIPMTGSGARNKGMALFPEKIDGNYAMISRQDGENLYLVTSPSLTDWGEGDRLIRPEYPWEFIQIGNCGPPIRLDEGWLLLTHGVGAMRKYSIGAILLDRNEPSRIIGRSAEPLLAAALQDRDGYVPNVVYTCGGMRVGHALFLPYGVADSSIAFATVSIADVLGKLH